MYKRSQASFRFFSRLNIVVLLCLVTILCPVMSTTARADDDREELGKAMEYFQSNKYHEALLILQRLDKKHRLSPRLQAYIALCYFYEQNYEDACRRFDQIIPSLTSLAPQEKSIYNYSAAESHFQLEHYDKAIPYYEAVLTLCHDNERADVQFHLGFCHLQLEHIEEAKNILTESLESYENFGYTPDKQARLVQLRKIIKALNKPE